MGQTFNIYCDESAHLENDHLKVMVLGAIWCPVEEIREVSSRIKEIKKRHGVSPDFEFKWTKISPAKIQFYLDILDYFFDNDDLRFRALVIPDKTKLRHPEFGQSHDDWYYKMYFTMLKTVLSSNATFRIYLDVKDTRSQAKVDALHDALCKVAYDYDRRIVERVQTVRSHEVSALQLTDLLIGAVNYANRKLETSAAKLSFVERFKERSMYSLVRSTLPSEDKVNIVIWKAREDD